MIEKEIKILLSDCEYELVRNLYIWNKEMLQINYYYGNKDFFDLETTIRVRNVDHRLFLQVKIPVEYENSLHIKEEYQKEIYDIPEVITECELEKLTGRKICQDVIKLGCLETTRSISLEYPNIEICLDKNVYLGKEDYELEIEYKSEYPEEVIDNFRRLGIDVNREVHGKFSRFMYAKNESIAKMLKRDK